MNRNKQQVAVIIGAGPAGLTAALELLERTPIQPVILEKSLDIGGLSRTVAYRGNRMDIGGHRFFSKSQLITDKLQSILPLQGAPAKDERLQGGERAGCLVPGGPDPETEDNVMLLRRRVSRIFYQRQFFDYPLSLNARTLVQLGLGTALRMGTSYGRAVLMPIRKVRTLEDFFINRFGRTIYEMFFKDYTAKVWGRPCHQISPDWGVQRVKGLSIGKAVWHALCQRLGGRRDRQGETSLISQFMYPKYGPGQLWEECARSILAQGGRILMGHEVIGVECSGGIVRNVLFRSPGQHSIQALGGDYFLSSMPLKELILGWQGDIPEQAKRVGSGLEYRDFITVGILAKRSALTLPIGRTDTGTMIPDQWIYVQEKDVRLGRIQFFNNWSPYLVRDPDTAWMGLEYFVAEGDDLWTLDDALLRDYAAVELERLGFIRKDDVLDGVVVRVPKAYPSYFGVYDEIATLREFINTIKNLFPIGRNGMHRYNNMDHSMLTAMSAVDNILEGKSSKENIWAVNAEEAYHENK